MKITYSRGAEYSVLSGLEMELDDWGHVVTENGTPVPSGCGDDSVRIDNVAGFIHDETAPNDTRISCGCFPCMVRASSPWESPDGYDEDENMTYNNHTDLVDDGHRICNRCGTEYDSDAQEPPEDASFYWVPSCPDCGADMTANPTDRTWLDIISTEIGGGRLTPDTDNFERRREIIHAHSRLYHGRLANQTTEQLVKIAQWFDRQAKSGTAYGPRFYRDIAFAVRKQARRQG